MVPSRRGILLALAPRLVLLLALHQPSRADAELRFREVAASWGARFVHHNGAAGSFYMIETMGSGVVVVDYDLDGDEDLLFVDSGARPDHAGEARTVLLRNDGPDGAAGRYVDVTARAGIAVAAYGMGAAAGDVDGDGDPDLYLTAFGRNQLFENRGDGTFADVTERSGAGDASWSSSAAFADLDQDGDLDLYLTHYVDFAYDKNPICGLEARGLRSYCHPNVYQGLPDRYFRNRGDGTFEDRTREAGFAVPPGNGLGVCAGDLDGDGRTDLYVANDQSPSFLFRNRGDGTFEEMGLISGTALSDQGRAEAGMGIELNDLDGDGLADLMVTHLDLETSVVYLGLGGLLFRDARHVTGLAEPSAHKVGFGVAAGDYDQDGDLDLAVANGHIIHNVDQWGTGTTYRQANQLFENLGGGKFRELEDAGLAVVRASRGMAAGDLDGDGDLDLVVSNSNEASELYENLSPASSSAARWLQVDLAAAAGNRIGVGARAEVGEGAKATWREVRTGCSYQSQNAMTLHFGLGAATASPPLRIRWPSGHQQSIRGLPANVRVRVAAPGAPP